MLKKDANQDYKHQMAENRLNSLEDENRELRQHIQELKAQTERCDKMTKDVHAKTRSTLDPEPETHTQFTALGCTGAMVTLSCPSGRTIMTTSANYGQYDDACSGCCAPNPMYDCTELVEENRPTDWAGIQLLCDNQTSCEFQNLGSIIDSCEVGYTSDYMQVFYDCLPHDETGPVAFTAWANTGNPTDYVSADIIVFNEVLSNIGGHYNTDTSSFICPWDGVYVFSVDVQGYVSDPSHIDLMQNSDYRTRVFNDEISYAYNRGSMTTVLDCQHGDVIWIRAGSTCSIYGGYQPYTTFSGFLLQRY